MPLSSDFQTPPLAEPINKVILPDGSGVAAIAETRPLMVAEPIFRAFKPEMVAEEYGGFSSARRDVTKQRTTRAERFRKRIKGDYFAAAAGK